MPPPRLRDDDDAPPPRRGPGGDRGPLKGRKAEPKDDDSDEAPIRPAPGKKPELDDSGEAPPRTPAKAGKPTAQPPGGRPLTPPGGGGAKARASGQGATSKGPARTATSAARGGGGSKAPFVAGAIGLLVIAGVGAALLGGEDPAPTMPTGLRPPSATTPTDLDPPPPRPGTSPSTPDRPDAPTTPRSTSPSPDTPPATPVRPGTGAGPAATRVDAGSTTGQAVGPRANGPAPGAVPLTLRCTDAQGAPLPGVTIEVQRASGAPLAQVVSNAQGEASYVGLPAGERIAGAARHPLSRETVAFGPLELTTGSVVSLKFKSAATGRIKGRIVDGDGQPVRDAALVVVDPAQQGEATLDALALGLGPDGSFQATVAAGKYAVSARAPGFSSSDRSYVTVPEDGETGPIDLLVLRQGKISGVVSLPPDLTRVLPVKLDLVMELTRGTEQNPWKTMDRRPLELDSTFRFDVPGCDPGLYRLRVELPAAGQNRVGPWVILTLTPGLETSGVTLVLAEVQSSIRGIVRDDRGDPVEGVEVVVRGRRATTDREGRYALAGLDEGDLAIEAKKKGYAPGFQRATYQGLELLVDLVLPRTGGVRGAVTSQSGPAASCPVAVVQKRDDGVLPYQVATDAQGRYLLEDLPPGAYFVKAGPGVDAFDPSGGTPVQVRAGEVVDVPSIALP